MWQTIISMRIGRLTLLVVTSLALYTSTAWAGSLQFVVNEPGQFEYARQLQIPKGFGAGEFSLEFSIRLAEDFPVGGTDSGFEQLQNWSIRDPAPYSSDNWWFAGNFLLDGHNNAQWSAGTFDVQIYGGGRLRWLFGDDLAAERPGKLWAIQAHPATSASSLLDGQWHRVALVRRSERVGAALELWIDGKLVARELTPRLVDMRRWWDRWASYPARQHGWFWGAEKQAAVGDLRQWEDYKGLLDKVRFWGRALSSAELRGNSLDQSGLLSEMSFEDGDSRRSCDARDSQLCWQLIAPHTTMRAEGSAP
jgi:hypothetical protein